MKETKLLEELFPKEEYILLNNIPSELKTLFKNTDAHLAGGAITSVFSRSFIKDYDLYFRNISSFAMAKSWFEKEAELIVRTESADTYKYKDKIYQLICHSNFINKPISDIISGFDFTICMGVYSFRYKLFTIHEDFMRHLAEKILVFNSKCKYPFSSLIRTIKYQKKGFKISGTEMTRLALKIHSIKMETLGDLKRQLMGVDVVLLQELWDSINPEDKYDFEKFLELMEQYIKQRYNIEEEEV